MSGDIDQLVEIFEARGMSRRELVAALTGLVPAAAAAPAATQRAPVTRSRRDGRLTASRWRSPTWRTTRGDLERKAREARKHCFVH